MKRLDAALPPIWSRADPVDIVGDADATRYATALEMLVEDPENDAILVMNVPTALASAQAAAESITSVAQAHRRKSVRPKPIFAVWVGSSDALHPSSNRLAFRITQPSPMRSAALCIWCATAKCSRH
jgi:acyl-CoA synthetase (NDP forming)